MPGVGTWLGDEYYQSLSTEKQGSLDQLHQATNWGLTIITTALLVTIIRARFPDRPSVILLSITLVAGWHYYVRALKGYANVMRYLLIQTGIIDYKFGRIAVSEAKDRVTTYHQNWYLPVTRTQLFVKGVVELGFGYLLVVNLAALIYALARIPHPGLTLVVVAGATVAVIVETVVFLRSPYMRAAPHAAAQRVR